MAKIAGLKGYYDIDVFDYPVPEPMDDSVLIKVEAAAGMISTYRSIKAST